MILTHSQNHWLECLQNPEAITSIFEDAPQLTNICLHRISFQESGWVCRIVLVIPELPSPVPIRWGDFNAVQIELGLADLSDVQVTGWPLERFGSATANRLGSEVVFDAVGTSFHFRVRSSSPIHVCSIKGTLIEGEWLSKFQSNRE